MVADRDNSSVQSEIRGSFQDEVAFEPERIHRLLDE